MKCVRKIARAAGLITVFVLLLSAGASAATFTVTKIADTADGTCDADCSLREAIIAANAAAGDDTIVFSSLFNSAQTITLSISGGGNNGDLDITTNIVITGPDARLLTVNQTVADERVFELTSGDTATISGMTISGGDENGDGSGVSVSGTMTLISVRVTGNTASGDGGGVFNTGTLTIRDSLIDGNTTTGANNQGGGVYNSGNTDVTTITNTTITNNTSGDDGGGIYANDGTVNLNNVTVSHNTTADSGGGIFDAGGNPTVNIRNTIVANNVSTGDAADEDITGSFTSSATAGGSNLIRIIGDATGFTNAVNGDAIGTAGTPLEPLLGALQSNFGQTFTRAIPFSSPAVNTGNNCVFTGTCTANNPSPALTLDQRGTAFTRQSGGTVDKGAFEFISGPTSAEVSVVGRVVNASGSGLPRVIVTISGGMLSTPRSVVTTGFGYYNFSGIPSGQSYVISVGSKRYEFANPSRVVFVGDNLTDIDFVAME